MYALGAVSGDLIWRYATQSSMRSSPAVSNGVVYVGAHRYLSALDANSGGLLWSYQTGWDSSPVVSGGVVYVGSSGYLSALDATTGELLWQYETENAVSTPAVSSGVIYISSADRLHALDAETGELLWSYKTRSITTPVVSRGVVYVGSADGYVYAIAAGSSAPPVDSESTPAAAASPTQIETKPEIPTCFPPAEPTSSTPGPTPLPTATQRRSALSILLRGPTSRLRRSGATMPTIP